MLNKIKGKHGEDIAAIYLQKHKYKIVERNFSCSAGEIDIITIDGETLVFVEVKARESRKFGNPAEAVDKFKQMKIIKTAEVFIQKMNVYSLEKRFDVIEVLDGKVNHIKSAFERNY